MMEDERFTSLSLDIKPNNRIVIDGFGTSQLQSILESIRNYEIAKEPVELKFKK